ncbi:MAG: MBL fold metallo-hydrolase [Gammaproteobacteria bacterium]|nr:MBL fold metallo-hydrolase [Gammaproteobacteria bacterium]
MSDIKFASTVILSRGSGLELEVYLALRAPELRFFGGYWVFPGGNLNRKVDSHSESDPLELALLRCVVRETLEEINILGSLLGTSFSDEQKNELKDLIKNSPKQWQSFLADYDTSLENINPVHRVTTPEFFPVRFDTQFTHVNLLDNESPQIDNYELVDGRFMKPIEAVYAWEQGKMEIAPPVLFLLRLLSEHGLEVFKNKAKDEESLLNTGKLHRIFFSPGIFMAPLRTPTLPPATTTNTIIIGTDSLFIIDPATPDKEEQQRLFDEMDALINQGKKFEAILLTHHHEDHVGAVNAVSQRYQLPVRAHKECYARIESGFIKGEALKEGDRLELGTAPDGSKDWHLAVMHTPGHAVDHLCYLESRYQAAVVGDMLSTISTILIDPPEGHMQTYLDNLQRLSEQGIKTLYPAHGPANRDGVALIKQFLEHRKHREKAVINALNYKSQSIDDLLPKIYDDVPKAVYPIASRSLLAGLIKLEEDNICTQDKNGWCLRQ